MVSVRISQDLVKIEALLVSSLLSLAVYRGMLDRQVEPGSNVLNGSGTNFGASLRWDNHVAGLPDR